MTDTVYTVTDDRGCSTCVTDPDRAERLSRAGYRVTATTF